MTTELPELLTVLDLARLLKRAPTNVRLMIRAGEIPATKLGGRWIVERELFLETLRVKSKQRDPRWLETMKRMN